MTKEQAQDLMLYEIIYRFKDEKFHPVLVVGKMKSIKRKGFDYDFRLPIEIDGNIGAVNYYNAEEFFTKEDVDAYYSQRQSKICKS